MEYVLQIMEPQTRSDFEARLAREPELVRAVENYRDNLKRLAALLPAAELPDTVWRAVEAELHRHKAPPGMDESNAADGAPLAAGCPGGD